MTYEKFWQGLWKNRETPWDQGGTHPLMQELLQLSNQYKPIITGASVWEPGCGSGHNGRWLAGQGFKVRSVDYVPEAIESALRLGKVENHDIQCQNIFDVKSHEVGFFDYIFDRALLCALEPNLRDKYVGDCVRRLRTGGFFWGILFDEVSAEKGPPFGLKYEEVIALFEGDFQLVAAETHPMPKRRVETIVSETLWIWQKCK